MASALGRLRRGAWVERARIAALADRILEVDRLLLRHGGEAALSEEEAHVLRALAGRMGAVPP